MKYVTPLNAIDIQTFHEMPRHHPARRARLRAPSLLLSHQGGAMPPMAQRSQVDRRCVSCWMDRWHTPGFGGF